MEKRTEKLRERDGRRRVVIERVKPEVDCGRFPIKRTVGEEVWVEADVFADSESELSCVLKYRKDEAIGWQEIAMQRLVNDRWGGAFLVSEIGTYRYTLEAWVDRFRSWRKDFAKRVEAEQDLPVHLMVLVELIEETSGRAPHPHATTLKNWAGELKQALQRNPSAAVEQALHSDLSALMESTSERGFSTCYGKELRVTVDSPRARFSSWYEMFPRSAAPEGRRHGTFKDCEQRLAYVAAMGFDTLYLPPIHSIGTTHRKGKNNSPQTNEDDPGSPWAIGSAQGGHTAVHRELGTLDDFRSLVNKCAQHGIEIALDLAFQCSPDHPYVKEHPAWFRWLPNETIQCAENPPKKYEDIYPLDFQTENWFELWEELKNVVMFWIAQGIRIFRVDNPHTKPFAFWEWLIREIKRGWPDVIFLSEAFTRPKIMLRLAKLGFSHSYTYFAWRNTKRELTEYFTELHQTEIREYFRPHLWPNTPDILTECLQTGGRPAFMTRLVLAATLGANYGIYGPPFETCERQARESGSEEYLNSEKYEIRYWDVYGKESLSGFVGLVNRIRRENPALQRDRNLHFHPTDNELLIGYSKRNEDRSNVILCIVNLDPRHTQSGWVELSPEELGLDPDGSVDVHDLLSGAHYLWNGRRNYVELNPEGIPAHIFRVARV